MTMTVWLIEQINMGGREKLVWAFEHKATCELRCKDMTEEWQDYKPFEAEAELIPPKDNIERVIVERNVYDLDRTDITEEIKRRAKEKLDPNEIKALGL